MLFWFGFQFRRALNLISKRLLRAKFFDDFDWSNYTKQDYGPQLNEMSKQNDLLLPPDFHLTLSDSNLGLNPEIEQLYHRLLELGPNQILEVGAGAGSNLINLKLLLPNAQIRGVELLSTQVSLGKSLFGPRFPENDVTVADFVKEDLTSLGDYELVFTNAVAMHLNLKKVKTLILKMLKHSRRYVLLHENLVQSHNFFQALSDLSELVEFNFVIEKPAKSAFGFVILRKN